MCEALLGALCPGLPELSQPSSDLSPRFKRQGRERVGGGPHHNLCSFLAANLGRKVLLLGGTSFSVIFTFSFYLALSSFPFLVVQPIFLLTRGCPSANFILSADEATRGRLSQWGRP